MSDEKLRERKRKHDDAHYPLQGSGRRANRKPVGTKFNAPKCRDCGKWPATMIHLCDGELLAALTDGKEGGG